MQDIIYRQDAIDAMHQYSHFDDFDVSVVDEDTAITALKELPSAQPGWIPWNSGRFPEESGTYTVTAYDGATKRVTYAKYQKRLKRWELTGARAYLRVLAWMPLPAPYRTEGDDNHEG